MCAAVAAGAVQQETAATRAWEKIGDTLVLLAYSAVVLFTVRYHEKWADEAQAWLIARDLDLKSIWFHELRYEGSPGLWHTILWIAQHVFHLPYATLGYIGVVFAIAGVAVLIYKSPFPWYIRWPLAFTYVMVYQYAVIARPYTLLPLLCFLVGIFFKDVEHPGRMTAVLVLLANLSTHGALLAACFGLLYALDAAKQRHTVELRTRKQYFLCAAILLVTYAALFAVLKPPPDTEEFVVKKELAKLPESVRQQLHIASPAKKLETIVSGGFLDFLIPSTIFLFAGALWCASRRRLLLFLLPLIAMLGLYSLVHGYAHHHGTAFLVVLTAIWIAWSTGQEISSAGPRERWALRSMGGLLAILCIVNIWDAVVVIRREYLYPYSGAEDAANYIRSVGADRVPLFGYLFGVNAVQAYFDHNIFTNQPHSYFHLALSLDPAKITEYELNKPRPEYIVCYSTDPQLAMEKDAPTWNSAGYALVHFSDGYYLYKQSVYQRETYFIYRRVHPTSEQTPQPLSPDK